MPNSVGWGASGPTNGESAKGYTQRDGGYDDCIMRIAQSMVNPDHYQLTWLGAKTKCNSAIVRTTLMRYEQSIVRSKTIQR